MTKPPPGDTDPERKPSVTEKPVDDFERVYQRQSGKRWDADYENDNDDT